MRIHDRKNITLTPDDIREAIERYLTEVGIKDPNCDIKFIVEETYQKDSMTGYYKPEFKGAEVTVLTHES